MEWKYQNFKPSEFNCPELMNPVLLSMLDRARNALGEPIFITSSYRSVLRNVVCGGVYDSSHTRGNAVDIRCSNGVYRFRLINALLEAGFTRIGVYEYHIHVDVESACHGKSTPNLWVGKYK